MVTELMNESRDVIIPRLAIFITWHTAQAQKNIDAFITSYSLNVLDEYLLLLLLIIIITRIK